MRSVILTKLRNEIVYLDPPLEDVKRIAEECGCSEEMSTFTARFEGMYTRLQCNDANEHPKQSDVAAFIEKMRQLPYVEEVEILPPSKWPSKMK